MQVQPQAQTAVTTATTTDMVVAGLVDGVEKKKKDFPLKFCTVCASNQNRFVIIPLQSFYFPDIHSIGSRGVSVLGFFSFSFSACRGYFISCEGGWV